MRGREHDEREVKKDRRRRECIEARIANCYYPGDNKTVTIFADSERGKHERARRRTERITRTKKRERRQTGKDDEKIGYEERERPIGEEKDGRTPPFTLEQEKKRIKHERGRLGTKKRTCQVAGTLRPLPPPSTPFGFLRRPFPCPASRPRTSSRPLLFDDSFRYYYSYRTTPTAEESSFCEI